MKEKILTEITEYCEECASHECCPEEECVLYRIEKMIDDLEIKNKKYEVEQMTKEELIIGFFEKGYCCDLDEVKNTCLGLLKENQELKEKLKATNKGLKKVVLKRKKWKHRYQLAKHENQELNKQLKEIYEGKRPVICPYHGDAYLTQEMEYQARKTLENQQKEFIEYLEKTIGKLECDDVGDEDLKGYLLQRIDTFKEILQKYKEINHIADVGKIVGGKE